ncbi:unnamed protein product, partial [Sphenostylis stenocarpa]
NQCLDVEPEFIGVKRCSFGLTKWTARRCFGQARVANSSKIMIEMSRNRIGWRWFVLIGAAEYDAELNHNAVLELQA